MKRIDQRGEILLHEWVSFDPARHDIPRSQSHCPIAHAIKRWNPELSWIMVKNNTISFTHLGERMRWVYQTPPEAMRFIHDIDHGKYDRGFFLVLHVEELIKATYLGPTLRPGVIEHDGRGSGPRGPRLRPVSV